MSEKTSLYQALSTLRPLWRVWCIPFLLVLGLAAVLLLLLSDAIGAATVFSLILAVLIAGMARLVLCAFQLFWEILRYESCEVGNLVIHHDPIRLDVSHAKDLLGGGGTVAESTSGHAIAFVSEPIHLYLIPRQLYAKREISFLERFAAAKSNVVFLDDGMVDAVAGKMRNLFRERTGEKRRSGRKDVGNQ
jgi:hypothetical protein